MNLAVIIFLVTLIVYTALTSQLLYVWWKYGKDEKGVQMAFITFISGSVILLAYMITI